MATLHIEHGITDYPTWKRAFDGFAERRNDAGVIAQRVQVLDGDSKYIVLQLDFLSDDQARGFKKFLEGQIWTSPDKSPALQGVPRARVLVDPPS